MKILLVHNFYGSQAPSGENQVFEAEKALLEKNGHRVEVYTRDSDEIRNKKVLGTLQGGASVVWNPMTKALIQKKVNEFKPDIIHVHNTFPLLSPSIFYIEDNKVPIVMTLHNYRLFCAAGIPIRNNSVCTKCIDQASVLPALKYGCYRDSRLATIPIALNISLHRRLGTWNNKLDAFIVLTEFQKQKVIQGGINSNIVHVKPNFYSGQPLFKPYDTRSENIVFVGRLSNEKGITTLIDAWNDWGLSAPQLRIIGDGPLKTSLQDRATNANVKFIGQISFQEVQSEISNSKLLILPSECYEGFPMVIREAFALGTPVAVSNLGPLPTIVVNNINGVVFEPWSPRSLKTTVQALWSNNKLLSFLSNGARNSYERLYNEKSNYSRLIEIYKHVIDKVIN